MGLGGFIMIQITVTEFARNLRAMFDRIEHEKEEIILIRNNHPIAKIIPGNNSLNATEAMGDLYRTLSDDAAKNWLEESRMPNTLVNDVPKAWDS